LAKSTIVTSRRRELTEHVRCPKYGGNGEAHSESEGAPCDEVLRKRSSNPEEALNEQVDEEGRSAADAASTRNRETDLGDASHEMMIYGGYNCEGMDVTDK
jgi:hypothetical protein